MAKLRKIIAFLDKELKIKHIADTSRNGLQVISSKKDLNKEIKRAGFAVDACMTTFQKAKKAEVDLLIVHHGLLWKRKKKDCHLLKKRTGFLKKNNISLYASHLPLDKNEKYGNNIALFRLLEKSGLLRSSIKKFGNYRGQTIGYSGSFRKPATTETIGRTISKALKTKCTIIRRKEQSHKKIRTIGIISGRSSSLLCEAMEKKLDCLLTGEICHEDACEARDSKLLIITAGHYATETTGLKALMPMLKQKFNIETVFIEDKTGL